MKLFRLSFGLSVIAPLLAIAAFYLHHTHGHIGQGFWSFLVRVVVSITFIVVFVLFKVLTRPKEDTRRINEVLAQFPSPVTFRSSSSPNMRMLAGLCAVLAAALIYIGIMGRGLRTGHPQPDIGGAVVMFSFAALCLVGIRIAVIQLRSGSLRLDEMGFETFGFWHKRCLWSEVTDIRRLCFTAMDRVGFRVKPPTDPEARLNLRFTGGEDDWLHDNYGFNVEDLTQLMAAWQSRAINGGTS